MKEELISVRELVVMYQMSLDSFLLPLKLAGDVEELDKRYRESITPEQWTRRRTELKADVDKIIVDVLSGNTGVPPELFLRRIPNETLVYYCDRLLAARSALEASSQHSETMIPCPASWVDYWIEFLVKKSWDSDPDNS